MDPVAEDFAKEHGSLDYVQALADSYANEHGSLDYA